MIFPSCSSAQDLSRCAVRGGLSFLFPALRSLLQPRSRPPPPAIPAFHLLRFSSPRGFQQRRGKPRQPSGNGYRQRPNVSRDSVPLLPQGAICVNDKTSRVAGCRDAGGGSQACRVKVIRIREGKAGAAYLVCGDEPGETAPHRTSGSFWISVRTSVTCGSSLLQSRARRGGRQVHGGASR